MSSENFLGFDSGDENNYCGLLFVSKYRDRHRLLLGIITYRSVQFSKKKHSIFLPAESRDKKLMSIASSVWHYVLASGQLVLTR